MGIKNQEFYAGAVSVGKYIYLKIKPTHKIAIELNKCIEEYAPNEKNKAKLKRTLLFCKEYNKIRFNEYFEYGFDKLNEKGREEYVGWYQLSEFYHKFRKNDAHEIFHDKEKCYEAFKGYYGREIVKVASEDDREKFDSFVMSHKRFIIKPMSDCKGHGVRIIDGKYNSDELFDECLEFPEGAVLEELIVESEELAKFHPASVNTIRFVTFYDKGEVHKILAAIRMGRNGNSVDNASAGGIYATIDMGTGIIDCPAKSFTMEKYFYHPDTGVQILGAKIPKWKELNELVDKVVKVVPEQRQIGWDFALTDKGWIIVEGNDRPGIQHLCPGKGLRKEIQCMYDAYAEECNSKI